MPYNHLQPFTAYSQSMYWFTTIKNSFTIIYNPLTTISNPFAIHWQPFTTIYNHLQPIYSHLQSIYNPFTAINNPTTTHLQPIYNQSQSQLVYYYTSMISLTMNYKIIVKKLLVLYTLGSSAIANRFLTIMQATTL